MSHLYKQYLKLLEHWPIDSTKSGRDLGEFLRKQVKEGFRTGGEPIGDPKFCERNLESLNRLAGDTYTKQYSRSLYYSSCGLRPEDCRKLVANENLEKQNLGFFEGIVWGIRKQIRNMRLNW